MTIKKFILVAMAALVFLQPTIITAAEESIPVYYNDQTERIFAYSDQSEKSDSEKSKKIALTFDDGPHPRYTQEILDILKEHNITATFYVLGENVEKYPQVFQQIVEQGHEIGNHTYDHNIGGKSAEDIANQLKKTAKIIDETTGKSPTTFRPPGGLINSSVKSAARELEYPIILWNIDPRDWRNPPAGAMAEYVKKTVKSGDVILFHDFNVANSHTPDAVRSIVPWLAEQGYEFVTVSQLFEFQAFTTTSL